MEQRGLNPDKFIHLRYDLHRRAKTFSAITRKTDLVFRLFTPNDNGFSHLPLPRSWDDVVNRIAVGPRSPTRLWH
jgi:hypothetical protein